MMLRKIFRNLKHLKTVFCLLDMQAFSCLVAKVTPVNFRFVCLIFVGT